MENQLLELLINSSYHIMENMKGENSMQIFVLTNFIWVIIIFFLNHKYSKMLERALNIAQNQDHLLDNIDEWFKNLEHKKEVYKLEDEINELKSQIKTQRELIKQLKK